MPRQPARTRKDTTEQLRDDIDSGRTGDKVVASDPAAAPLGADEEAAGKPPDPAAVRRARDEELRGGHRRERPFAPLAIYLLVIAAIAAALAVILWR